MHFARTGAITASLFTFAVSSGCDSPTKQPAADLKDFQDFSLAQRLEDFNWITSIFEENYAMLEFKEQRYGFNWDDLKRQYLQTISADGVTRDSFAATMQEFVATMRDAHTAARPLRNGIVDGYSVKVTTLGFLTERDTQGAGTQAKVTKTYKGFFPSDDSAPVKAGDYVVAIDGRDVNQIIREDITRYRDLGQPESNLTFGISALANRFNISFATTPTGYATVKLLRNGSPLEVRLPWVTANVDDLKTEDDSDNAATNKNAYRYRITGVKADGSIVVQRSESGPMRLDELASQSVAAAPLKRSLAVQDDVMLQRYLGVTESGDYPSTAADFTAEGLEFKLLATDQGLAAVYRVEDFMFSRLNCGEFVDIGDGIKIALCKPLTGEDYAKAFAKLKAIGAKSLVVDLRGNGGGALGFGYELLRAFSTGGVDANLASLRLNEEWVGEFKDMSQAPSLPLSVRQGYQQQFAVLQGDVAAQRRLSSPVAITGLTTLPGTTDAWTGPTYLLTDEMCASMCDIFSTAMQDQNLAKVIGKQSMGAGGNIIGFQWSPHAKIQVTQTASIMYRADGSVIENEGVTPDVSTATTTGDSFWTEVKRAIDTTP